MRLKHSDYMYWAKTRQSARYNLATSGVGAYPLSGIPNALDHLEINGNNSYGYAPLVNAIAAHTGADPDCVVTVQGTSFANHLAMAALIEPGDDVLIEQPAYELLVSTAAYIGGRVVRFLRREEDGYALRASEVLGALTPNTRLIVITNLHNPSSVLASQEELKAIGEIARHAGARVLVDEVYLDAVYPDTPASAFHLGPEFVVTSSLTKVYGVSGLRCGWILAQPDLARAMWRLNDLFAATPAHPAEIISVAAFAHLPAIREVARRIVDADRQALAEFLASTPHFRAARTAFGTTAFLRLIGGDVDEFEQVLREVEEVSIAPGRFFNSASHFRIGLGVNSAMFAEGLCRLDRAAAAP